MKKLLLAGLITAILPATAFAQTFSFAPNVPWLPGLAGSSTAGTPTYANNGQSGLYFQIGKLIIASFYINASGLSGATGNITVTGLPFAANNNLQGDGMCSVGNVTGITLDSGYTQFWLGVMAGSTSAKLAENGSNHTAQQIAVANITGSPTIAGTCIYTSN